MLYLYTKGISLLDGLVLICRFFIRTELMTLIGICLLGMCQGDAVTFAPCLTGHRC